MDVCPCTFYYGHPVEDFILQEATPIDDSFAPLYIEVLKGQFGALDCYIDGRHVFRMSDVSVFLLIKKCVCLFFL